MSTDANAEARTFRSMLRDLVGLSAMSAVWVSKEPAAVAAGLADVMTGLLQLDFIFVRLSAPGVAGAAEVIRGKQWKTFPEWLESYLADRGRRLSGRQIVSDIRGGPSRGIVIPIGVGAEGGVIAATCERVDFPSETDRLLLGVAANHAAAVFQGARLKEQKAQMWFLEGMHKVDRVIQGANDLDRMMGDVLDVVLATFTCDRAWLVYPCDSDVFRLDGRKVVHRVRQERTRPDDVGARAAGLGIPNDPDIVGVSRIALSSDGPVQFGPESDNALPARIAERFGVKSMMAMAIHPKMDTPYLLGLHQCSYPRVWTGREERLFDEIGRRLADALDTQLMFRGLREGERKLSESRAELAASRARIIAAADQSRRQIERDMHDGVQQRLVSLVLAHRTAEALVPPGPSELRARLSEVGEGLVSALEELRELSRGIHPAVLARGGLARALEALARRSAVPVRVEVRTRTRLPEPVEVAAYYVVSEALTNTAKHAQASEVRVTVEVSDGVLRLSIRDDGRGGADPARGSGLVGLADRVDALGGTIDVASPVGQGTTLRVALPIEEAALRDGGVPSQLSSRFLSPP